MFLRIENLASKKLVGKSMQMTLSEDRTRELWRSFMPERFSIKNRVNEDYLSMQVYDQAVKFSDFGPDTVFIKWAAVEVSDFGEIPEGMESYSMSGGLYAVFLHRGPAAAFPKTLHYIFAGWMPQSGYELDTREHFEVLKEDYDPADAGAEEAVWVPVRKVPNSSSRP